MLVVGVWEAGHLAVLWLVPARLPTTAAGGRSSDLRQNLPVAPDEGTGGSHSA